MKKIILFFALLVASGLSLAKPVILDLSNDDTISVYTLYGGAYMGIAKGLDVNLVIDGLTLKATTEESDVPSFTSIKLPSSLVNKTITKAEVKKWVTGGKVYQCTADNLPLIVMHGNDYNSSTQIHFTCSKV